MVLGSAHTLSGWKTGTGGGLWSVGRPSSVFWLLMDINRYADRPISSYVNRIGQNEEQNQGKCQMS